MIPCKVCGQLTPTELCNGCYEFDRNINRILETVSGRAFIYDIVGTHYCRERAKARITRICELRMLGYEV